MRLIISFNNKNVILPEPWAPSGPANNEIWYTSSDGNIVTPFKTNELPEIDTNTYSDGKGVIKFKTDVTSIGYMAFAGRSSLTSVAIPNSVTSIGEYAFSNCPGLTSVTIPNSVTSIGIGAFSSCTSLTSVTIPNSVTSIGISAFSGCSGLTSINVAFDNTNYCSVDGVLFNKYKTIVIGYPGGKQGSYMIPDSVTSIGGSAFIRCSGLSSVAIPNSVTSIGNYAFENCIGLSSISYTGTISQYNSITKGSGWRRNVPATVVHCTDGDAPI